MPETTGERGGQGGATAAEVDDEVDPRDIIPLKLLRSQRIPPAPNRRKSAIDWLPDYAGFSWIAYGASSLAVIAHCASPLISEETQVGSFFQQVIEPPSGDPESCSSEVKAVAWCHSHPFDGNIAVGWGSKVVVYSPDTTQGSLRWQHSVLLSHSSTVEAVSWTMLGDGLISVGTEITFWKRRVDLWEMTIKLRTEVPQTIVSTTWSLDGPVASATGVVHCPLSSPLRDSTDALPSFEASRLVLVCQNDGNNGHSRTVLSHPQPVSFIQWRPLNMVQLKKNPNYLQRDVLLTSCLDGVVRLWSKIDGGKSKKISKENNNSNNISYHVIAAIEVNQCLKGDLGSNVFVSWGTETYGTISVVGSEQPLPVGHSDCNQIGICEWLIGVGPDLSLTFWALHCLDDIAPLRFPRVKLWKKHDTSLLCTTSNTTSQSVLIKTVISRNELYAPPKLCCLLQLLPNNSVRWLHLSKAKSDSKSAEFSSKESLSSFITSDQVHDGHEGMILHVAVHPCSEVNLTVSLDLNGILLFWSVSSISTFPLGMEPLQNASWKLLGKVVLRELSSDEVEYSNLAWAPSVYGEDRFLLMGHAEGIDCYLVKFSDMENEEMVFDRMFTVSFTSTSRSGDEPYTIFAFLLPSKCRQPPAFNHFMLFAVWEKEFQILTWDITMHAENISQNICYSNPDCADVIASSTFRYKSSRIGWLFHVKVVPCSRFPTLHDYAEVTSYSVVSSSILFPSVEHVSSSGGLSSLPYFYHITTGHSDGSLRFWRIKYETLSGESWDISCLPWELVGLLKSHQDPVYLISWSNCGSKLATACLSTTGSSCILHIWGSMSLVNGGCFVLEDKIVLHGTPVALSWLQLGNGLLLLGICMLNELRIYTQLRLRETVSSKLERSISSFGWSCIAVCQSDSSIKGFVWGPNATPVLIHKNYFSLFSHWSLGREMNDGFGKHHSTMNASDQPENIVEYFSSISGKSDVRQSIQSNERDYDLSVGGSKLEDICRKSSSSNTESLKSSTSAVSVRMNNILNFCERHCGSLPVFHPKALVLYLYSGRSKRVHASLLHLIEYLQSFENSKSDRTNSKTEKSLHGIPEICLSKYLEEVRITSAWAKGSDYSANKFSKPSDKRFMDNLFHLVEKNTVGNNFSTHFATSQQFVNTPWATSQQSETRNLKDVLKSLQHVIPLNIEEKIQMFAIVELLSECCNPQYSSTYDSFDEPGRRFWVTARLKQLHFHQKVGRPAAADELMVESWMIAWAYHSDCQENLFNSVISSEPTWKELRNMGVGYWLTNVSRLRLTMEKLARSQYILKKDPKDSALLYLALNRLPVLAGLFRLSKDEKDKPLVGFLSRNFQEEKNKAAALKNAYVLLGRHQLELAIAFFLLGGDHSSAVTVCAKNLGDEQLALVICRLVEGFGGPLEHQLISGTLLPNAYDNGDYWLSSLFEWALGNYSQSIKALAKSCLNPATESSNILHNALLSDPNIGQYCRILASKNSMRNALGEVMAAELSKWATAITAKALQICGFPLEALDCMSCSVYNLDKKEHLSSSSMPEYDALYDILNLRLKTSDGNCNWLLEDIAQTLELLNLLNFSMYVSKLLFDFPNWQVDSLMMFAALLSNENDETCNRESLKTNRKIQAAILILDNKFSLKPRYIYKMLEALDCMSCSVNSRDKKEHLSSSSMPEYDALYDILNLRLKTSDGNCNWLLEDVAQTLELHNLLNFSMLYVSKLLFDFPDWQVDSLMFPALLSNENDETCNGESLKTNRKIQAAILILDNKFSLKPRYIYKMILIYSYNRHLMLPGYNTLRGYTSSDFLDDNKKTEDEFLLQQIVPQILLKATKELSHFLIKFMLYHSITGSITPNGAASKDRCSTSYLQIISLNGIINSLWSLRNFAKLHESSSLYADMSFKGSLAFDHMILFSFFGFTWFARSLKGLFLVAQPLLRQLDKESINQTIGDEKAIQDIGKNIFSIYNTQCQESKFENETWLLLGTSLLNRMHDLFINIPRIVENGTSDHLEGLNKPKETIPSFLANNMALSVAYVFLMLKKHFLSILWQKMEKGISICAIFDLEESINFKASEISDPVNQESDYAQLLNHEDVNPLSYFVKFLLKPEELCRNLLNHNLECKNKLCGCWDDINKCIMSMKKCKEEADTDSDLDLLAVTTSSATKKDMLSVSNTSDKGYLEGARENYSLERSMYFQTPKDVYKKSGELIEALCFNCVDDQKVVLASNRKGILYFDIDAQQPIKYQDEYTWETSDWPCEGWVGSEVTATCTSDLAMFHMDSKRAVGDTTAGSGSLARPGRDLTGGGAFGIPGYAGIGASGFGWNVQEDFDESIDLPAMLENVNARALSSHPSRPFFLVGSSNTHVYLWEFGKKRATATYGVLPVSGPPPYALASISALHFDHYGQRFATAAMDGSICTWQLEVGGKGNVYPTESSQCFNNHAADLAFMSSSGSVIAAAGHNTNNVNVVVWDTLAPPATSQASVVCHEGGARSLSVLDTGLGCGSLSPVIVTGGKNGDIGLYDFRFVATGRMRKHRNFSEQTLNSPSLHGANALAVKSVDSLNGMLWNIPKAHSGSITKIAAIPSTSLFLTGSKDGDVKLWDASKSQLVAHWQKLHEKHTFLQPSSGNFGGIVRAAVTDIQVHPCGFLTCGGDGLVKFVQLKRFQSSK